MKKSFFAFCLILITLFGVAVETTTWAVPEIRQETIDLLKPKLNSDRIEYFFGSYGVDPLDIDSPVFPLSRISNLHSLEHGKKVMRTLAVVDYFQPVSPELANVHQEIKEGKSIGIALREHGWIIHKNPVFFGVTNLSPELMNWMDEPTVREAAVHIYRLNVSKKDKPELIPYCTIIEVHSPQYLSKEWLQVLYEDQYMNFSIRTSEVDNLLNRLSKLIKNFPNP